MVTAALLPAWAAAAVAAVAAVVVDIYIKGGR